MAFNFTWLVAGAFVVTAYLLVATIRYVLSTQRPKNFPPGPPTRLGLGNLHQIPLTLPFVQFQQWSKVYGDIIGLKIGPANIVILHNPQDVRELFDKRGTIYSGRPYSYIPYEHVLRDHTDKDILTMQHGPYLRQWRAAISPLVGRAGLKQTLPMQDATAANLVHKLLQTTPSDTLVHLKHWALETPLLAVVGQRLKDRGIAFADRFFNAQHQWLQILEPGKAPPIDIFPFLRWIPERFATWKTAARNIRDYMLEEYFEHLEVAKKLCSIVDGHIGSGNEPDKFRCLMTKLLEEQAAKEKGTRFTDNQMAFLGGAVIDAAVDTTWASIMSLVLLLAAHPDIQAKAHEDIDRVSSEKPPGGDTITQLPYIRACMLEMLRLCPPAPSALPHLLDKDDSFKGYSFPKNTTFLANVWALHRNPDDYDRPDEFLPERYLQHPLGLKSNAQPAEGRRETYAFGAGRRVCPGDQFAQNAILLTVAKLLWAFEIVAPEPLDVSIETGFHVGMVISPNPFKVDFVLRNEVRREAVVRDFEASSSVLDQLGL